jgi:hypothetical protein
MNGAVSIFTWREMRESSEVAGGAKTGRVGELGERPQKAVPTGELANCLRTGILVMK